MPHIHLETTSDLIENVQIPQILEALVARLCSFETINPAAVKAYHSLRSVWFMGEGAPAGFAHCSVGILAGRPEELRRQIADGMYAELKAQFVDSGVGAGLTLEVREMDAATYRK